MRSSIPWYIKLQLSALTGAGVFILLDTFYKHAQHGVCAYASV